MHKVRICQHDAPAELAGGPGDLVFYLDTVPRVGEDILIPASCGWGGGAAWTVQSILHLLPSRPLQDHIVVLAVSLFNIE
jgi:hypothetical protein